MSTGIDTSIETTPISIRSGSMPVSDDANVSVSVDEKGTAVAVVVANGTTADTGNVVLATVEVRARAPTVSGPPPLVPGPPENVGPPGSDDDGESEDGTDRRP